MAPNFYKLLESLGATIEQSGKFNRTALAFAAESGKTDIIEYIMKSFPEMIHSRDNFNHTAITLAINFETIDR